MGRGRKGSGVEPRINDIRVRFTLDGKRRYVVIEKSPTAANIAATKKLMRRVKNAVDEGTFSFEEFFPDAVELHEGGDVTVGDYLDKWLNTKSTLAPATVYQYWLAVANWKARKLHAGTKRECVLGDTSMQRVLHSDIAELVGAVKWPSARMRNNSLIVLRGAFAMWVADDRRNRFDPMEGIDNAKFQKGKPDPVTEADAERIVTRLYEKYDERIAAYFEFAIWSWLRPEEEIAILWSKLNESDRTVKINVARTFRGVTGPIKTYEERDLECNDRAWAALMRMKKWTFMKDHGHVFENPVTAKEWHTSRGLHENYWKPVLRVLGISERRAYCTRHTGITIALGRGCDPQWVARQAGHKNTKMIWEVYSKWIPGQDKGSERAKLGERKAA